LKALIIYFSQTGFTLKIGQKICDGIKDAGWDCEMTDIRKTEDYSLEEYDLIGIGCPVFYCREPFNVSDYIKNLPKMKNKLWFVYSTHGSILGRTLVSMAGNLKKKGAIVSGYFDCYADATMPYIPHPTLTTGHPDQIEYEEAYNFGEEIVSRSTKIAAGDLKLIPEPDPVEEEWLNRGNYMTHEVVKSISPPFNIDVEKCSSCGECEDQCPVGGIDVEADPPRLQNPCIYCWRCIMVCPEFAINTDWEELEAKVPSSYAKYRKSLEKNVINGRFRWLTDPDKIDHSDNQHEKRKRGDFKVLS
jgi:flavodoxin/ferredoxin